MVNRQFERGIQLTIAIMLTIFFAASARAIFVEDGLNGARTTGHLEAHAAARAEEDRVRRQTNRALYQSTAQFKLATQGKQEVYALIPIALAAAHEGKKAEDIIKSVVKARQAQHKAASVRKTGKWISPTMRDITIDAASALGDGIGKGGGAVAAAALSRGVIGALESAVSGEKSYWAYRKHTDDRLTEPEAQRRILELYAQGHEEFPELLKADPYNPITHEIGFSPASSREAIIAAAPDKTVRDTIQMILDSQNDQNALTEQAITMMKTVRDGQASLTKDILTNLGNIGELLGQDRISRVRAKRRANEHETLAIKVRGVESMVYLTATLIGFKDPELSHQVQTIGDAGIKVYKAWETFTRVSTEFSELKGFASAALSADLVGATLAVVDLFIDTGPTPDELIIEQIGVLRDQVEVGRVQMHQRFNLVDQRLVGIHQTLIEGLGGLMLEVKKSREAAAHYNATMREELLTQREMLSDLYPASIDRTQAILTSLRDKTLAPCIRRRAVSSIAVDVQVFGHCVAVLQSLALDGELENMQIDLPETAQNIARTFERHPDAVVNAAVQKFHEFSSPHAPSFPSMVVGPESWLYLARAHDQFLHDWPQYLGTLANDPQYALRMKGYRERLADTIKTISDDLVLFANGEPNTTFGALVNTVRKEKNAVRRAIRRTIRKERKQDRFQGLKLWRGPARPSQWHKIETTNLMRILGDNNRFVYRGRACGDDEWDEFRGLSSIDFWRYPSFKKEKRYRLNLERVKKDLIKVLTDAFENMLAAGIGTLEVCVLGDILKEATEFDRATVDNDRSKGAYYEIEFNAKVLYKVLWRAKCEGEQVELRSDGWGDRGVDFEVFIGPAEGTKRAHHRILVDTGSERRSLKRQLILDAYWDAYSVSRDDFRQLTFDLEESPCIRTYVDAFMEKKREFAKTIRDHSDVDSAIRRYNGEIEKANAYLQSWVRLALHDAISLSDAVATLATGNMRFPLWGDAAEIAPDQTLLDRPERLEARIQTVETVLMSEEVAYMADEHSGYAGVTDTAYDSLDPKHPDVQRFWQGQKSY